MNHYVMLCYVMSCYVMLSPMCMYKDSSWPEFVENVQTLISAGFVCVFFFFFFNQCLYIRSTFCAPQGVAILVRSLPKKSKKEKEKRKKLSHDVIYTSATHAGFVHDVTDKDCHTENGSAQSRPFCGIPTCSCFDLEIAELDNTSAVNVFFKLHFHRYDPLGVSCNHYHLRQS